MLLFDCDVCNVNITDGQGYVCVDAYAASCFEEKQIAWEAENLANSTQEQLQLGVISGTSLLEYPDPVRWRFLHTACDSNPNGDDYWFAIERMRTPKDIMLNTAHLFETKTWFRHTDWDLVLHKVAAQLG